ncbi:hypothetical protein [Paraburkholderia caledonica]|uniref:hypothetical protein n=1 Tax=Paraburkholderia caledonica TaxID=134536 RepID=UPI000B3F94D7|nr:hypothetical protein [Paraburkholderia caledonica]
MTVTHQPPGDVPFGYWSIRAADSSRRHFVGWSVIDFEGRVSPSIRSFDSTTRTGITESGSQYRLIGRAGTHKDAEYVWDVAVKIWDHKAWADMTPTVVPDFRNRNRLAATTTGGVSNRHALEEDLSSQLAAIRYNLKYRSTIVRYRVAAYDRDVSDAAESTELRLLSQTVDEATVNIPTSGPTDAALEFYACAGTVLRQRRALDRRGAKDALPSGLILFVESPPLGAIRGETAAQFELLSDSTGVRGQMRVEERPRIDHGPLQAPIEGDLWHAVAQFLPDFTGELEAGGPARYEPYLLRSASFPRSISRFRSHALRIDITGQVS